MNVLIPKALAYSVSASLLLTFVSRDEGWFDSIVRYCTLSINCCINIRITGYGESRPDFLTFQLFGQSFG
ncbi:MAG: hypothetical protein AAF327_07385 [Cyanobacteria bacterium P01_A01_bin.37]